MTDLGPLLLDLAGTGLQPEEAELITSPQVGGIILFARNFESRPQLLDLVADIRALRPNLLLAVDQEGGRVQRFKAGFTRLPPMQFFYRDYCQQPNETLAFVEDVGWLMAAEILASGLDFSFAPVLDLDSDRCAVIADRAFADDADAVIALAGAFMRGMHGAGMATTGKHFPGHGSVEGDSHKVRPVDTRSREQIQRRDMRPFVELCPYLDAIMPAHICFPKVDAQPVGFSRVWLQQVLRRQLGFEGVIFSDDLSMEGASGAGGYRERAEAALTAGCDMVLACNNRQGALAILEWLNSVNSPSNPRLSTMARRRLWRWDELQENTRWRHTVARLNDVAQ